MTENNIINLADSKGLAIDEHKHGFSVKKNGEQIRFCFNKEKLIYFIESYGNEVINEAESVEDVVAPNAGNDGINTKDDGKRIKTDASKLSNIPLANKTLNSNHPDAYERISIFSPDGRITRRSYRVTILSIILLHAGLAFIVGEISSSRNGSGDGAAILLLLIFLPSIWVVLMACIKRWHDLDKSGWMSLTLFIPYIGLLIMLYLGVAPGTDGSNKYGQTPG